MAAGLHKVSMYHAQQIAWMALKMMEGANKQKSHDGNPLQVRVKTLVQLFVVNSFNILQNNCSVDLPS